MIILGRNLPDHKVLKIALTNFYGIGRKTALRLMARYSIHESLKVGELNQAQITSLTAYLSSPITSPRPFLTQVAPPSFSPGPLSAERQIVTPRITGRDSMAEIKIENDLRRQMQENIAHQRAVGSYVGRRHAMGLPVRGQRTRTNAVSAKKLNRVERRA